MKVVTVKEFHIPFYAKISILFVGLFVFIAILYLCSSIIIPLVFAVIIAIVLHPVVNFFVRIKLNRIIAILVTLLLTFVFIAALGLLIYSQASRFSESWPTLVEKFTLMLNQSITWASGYFNVDATRIREWIAKSKGELINISSASIGQTLLSIGSTIMVLFLIPVYTFLILFYHSLLLDFIHRIFSAHNQEKVSEIIKQIKTVIQRYLIGLLIEFVIVASLNSIGLLILGVDYAILLGIIGGLLNLIPYVGGLIAVSLPMMVAIVTKDNAWYAVYVLAIYYFIQLFDNNFVVPKIVASKVKINALFAIIAIIVGNALWGVPGMFLSVPLLAIVKLIFDHIEPLKPWGFLLGDTMPTLLKIKPIRIKRTNKI